jgi:hypothetical protein
LAHAKSTNEYCPYLFELQVCIRTKLAPEFQAELASQGKYLPAFSTQEFDEYLKCGRLEDG